MMDGKKENYQVCSVQYCVQQLCTVQCTEVNRPNSNCWLDSAFLWLSACYGLSVLDLTFWDYFVFAYVRFCCVRFSFFSTMPRDWLGRTSPK